MAKEYFPNIDFVEINNDGVGKIREEFGIKHGELLKSIYDHYPRMVSTLSCIIDAAGGIVYDTYKEFEKFKTVDGYDNFIKKLKTGDTDNFKYNYLDSNKSKSPLKTSNVNNSDCISLGDNDRQESEFLIFVRSNISHNNNIKDFNVIFNFEKYVNSVSDLRSSLSNPENEFISFDIENFQEFNTPINTEYSHIIDHTSVYKIRPNLLSIDKLPESTFSSELIPTCNFKILIDINKLIYTIIEQCKMPDQLGDAENVTTTREEYISNYISAEMHKYSESIIQLIILEMIDTNIKIKDQFPKFFNKCNDEYAKAINNSDFTWMIDRFKVLSKHLGIDINFKNYDNDINKIKLDDSTNKNFDILDDYVDYTNNDLLIALNNSLSNFENSSLPETLLSLSKVVFRRTFTHCFERALFVNVYSNTENDVKTNELCYYRESSEEFQYDKIDEYVNGSGLNLDIKDFYESMISTIKKLYMYEIDKSTTKIHMVLANKKRIWMLIYATISSIQRISIPLNNIINFVVKNELTNNKYYMSTVSMFGDMFTDLIKLLRYYSKPSGISSDYKYFNTRGNTSISKNIDLYSEKGIFDNIHDLDSNIRKTLSNDCECDKILLTLLSSYYSKYKYVDTRNNNSIMGMMKDLLNYTLGSFDSVYIDRCNGMFRDLYSIDNNEIESRIMQKGKSYISTVTGTTNML